MLSHTRLTPKPSTNSVVSTFQLFLGYNHSACGITVFLQLFNTFLLSNHYVPGIVLSA